MSDWTHLQAEGKGRFVGGALHVINYVRDWWGEGDEKFFVGLKRFYEAWRFRKAGTDDFRRVMEQETGLDLGRFFEQWVLGDGVPLVTYSWRLDRAEGAADVLVRLEQAGEPYQMPVTITLEYEDNSTTSATVSLTERVLATRLPVTKKLRRVDVNRDRGAVGVFRSAGSG
jgi:aminopeptidase N